MTCNQSIIPGFVRIILFISFTILHSSCFIMPNGGFERNKKSECVLFLMNTGEVQRRCNEGNYKSFTGLTVSAEYDTIMTINGRPSNSYILFEKKGEIILPYKLDTVLKDKSKKISISLDTDNWGNSYSLKINGKEWEQDTLHFTFYYNK